MIGKFGLAAAMASILLLAQPGGAGAASLSPSGTAAKLDTTDTVTEVRHRRKWRNHRGYRRNWRHRRSYNYGYYRPRYYNPYYNGYSSYYGYRPYRSYRRHYRRYHRPHFGIYISF